MFEHMTKQEYIEKFGIEKYNQRLEHNRENYKKRKDVWKVTRNQYYKNNKDYFNNYNKDYHKSVSGRARQLLYSYIHNDIKYQRGECEITYEWLMENVFNGQECLYCGESNPLKLGVDRIDNTLPHKPDNVVVCCKKCNLRRHTKEFDTYLMSIASDMTKN